MQSVNLGYGFTHGGTFHADDVFATALLRILNSDIEITRGFVVPEDFDGVVYDIGGGEFDHHQDGSRVRPNGVSYAAFGLLWERLGSHLLCDDDAARFDEEFVQPIDNCDNTGEQNQLSLVVSDFNPNWNDVGKTTDDGFFEAVEWAQEILERHLSKIRSAREAVDVVDAAVKACEGQVLELDRFVPWQQSVVGSQILYVIFPSLRGGYNVQAVPPKVNDHACVLPFPEAWRGADRGTLKSMTGIEGFGFCHKSGFLCAADDIDAARKIARLALDE